MYYAQLSKAPTSSGKKYTVIITDPLRNRKKTISFGALGYEDFTIHKDVERRDRYDRRHRKREDWSDPFTAGFWSKHLLWNKPTIEGSKRDISSRFKIKFI